MLLRPQDFPHQGFFDASYARDDAPALRRLAAGLGYLFQPRLLPPGPVDRLRARVRDLCQQRGWVQAQEGNPPEMLAAPGAALASRGWDDPEWLPLQLELREDPAYLAVAKHPALLGLMERLFGEPPALAAANFCWIKLPGSPEQTTLPHQDLYYLPESPAMWTVWLPLTHTPFEVGPLGVVPGPQNQRIWPHVSPDRGIDLPSTQVWHSSEVWPGDVVCFSATTIHCAWSNVSQRLVRASFDVRYLPRSTAERSALTPGRQT